MISSSSVVSRLCVTGVTVCAGLAFTMEYKYDGERAQVHLLEDGSVKIFSRNSEDNSQVRPRMMMLLPFSKSVLRHGVTLILRNTPSFLMCFVAPKGRG